MTITEIESRGDRLAEQVLRIWPHHDADTELVQAEHIRELKELAEQGNANDLEMNDAVRILLNELLSSIREFTDVIEVIKNRSVCCYAPEFFVELLPRSGYVRIILPLDLSEVMNHGELDMHDASTWTYVPNRVHKDSNLLVDIWSVEEIPPASLIIRQAFGQV